MRKIAPVVLCLGFVITEVSAQSNPPATTTVPRLVRVSNTFHPADGQAPAPVESVTLSIYSSEQAGSPLWQEAQNVSMDAQGHYSILMGATANDGVPLEVLNSTEPRWLGVQFNRPGETEQPRTLLTSVPYALRASDAETLGGLPPSAYQLAAPTTGTAVAVGAALTAGVVATSSTPVAKALKPRATTGTTNYIPLFTDSSGDTANSVLYQGTSRIGLGTTAPADYFHVRFSDSTGGFTGLAVQNLGSSSVSYSGMLFYDQNGVLGQFQGFNNSTHEYRINNIATGATINFMIGSSSKFYVANSGNIGIGTSTPAANLDIAGNLNFSGGVFYQGTSLLAVPGGVGNGNTATGLAALALTTGGHNTATGFQALGANTTGCCNAAVGWSALASNTTGSGNVAIGGAALSSNTTGSNNTGAGFHALNVNTTGSLNTAVGGGVLSTNTAGSNNTAIGQAAMMNNTTGCCNVAAGQAALTSSTTGSWNVAVGGSALQNNTTGSGNTASGQNALATNTTGSDNTAIGWHAMATNNAGGSVAVGSQAMQLSVDACCDAAFGTNALQNNTFGQQDTAIGGQALVNNTTGNSDIAVGFNAASAVSATNSNNIHIGTIGASADASAIRIGGGTSGIADTAVQTTFFVAGVNGVTTGMNNAVPVMIDSNGQLGTVSSSRRFKEDIHDMGDASRRLMQLRPVTFRYKKPFADGSKPIQYGLIAEEVAEVYPDLVARSADGQIETVKYQVLAPMLLNEVQRQQNEIDAQQREIQDMREEIRELKTLISTSNQGSR